jgi:hypothetical protein
LETVVTELDAAFEQDLVCLEPVMHFKGS